MLNILYKDDDLIAVHKPSGLLVHKSKISSDRTFLLQQLRDQINQQVYPVHRLDRPTSGVVLFALHSDSAAKICNMFRLQNIKKTYIALVRGFTDSENTIDYALKNEDKNIIQLAVTDYSLIKSVEINIPVGPYERSRYSLIKTMPRTGRKHQIRRHMAHIRHPIIGDVNHGDGHHNKMFRTEFNINRLLLMAYKIEFSHPYSQKSIIINAPIDPELKDLFTKLFDSNIMNDMDKVL